MTQSAQKSAEARLYDSDERERTSSRDHERRGVVRFSRSFVRFTDKAFWAGGFVLLAFWSAVLLFANVELAYGQQSESQTGAALFLPSADVDSQTFYSANDAERRNRPPQPAKTREDLFYPDGFLTLSSPTAPTPKSTRQSAAIEVVEDGKPEKKSNPLRPLDPSVETTPLLVPSITERPSQKRGDHVLFYVVSIALAGLGIFLYYDFQYRNQLKQDLVQNAKLCASTEPSDFDAVLAKEPDLKDPREPSFVNPTFNPDALAFEERQALSRYGLDSERFEVDNSRTPQGPSLNEENVDFVPRGLSGLASPIDDVVEDFVVGESHS